MPCCALLIADMIPDCYKPVVYIWHPALSVKTDRMSSGVVLMNSPVPMTMHLQCCGLRIKYHLVPISVEYLGGPAWELQDDVDRNNERSIVESSSDLKDDESNGRDQQPIFDTDFDDQYDHVTSLHLKDETATLESALYDLMYLCSAVTQKIVSFSYDLNLVFESQPAEPDHSVYQLYSSIPPGPNMGHRKLSPDASENAAILAHESGLYEVLVNLQHFEQFPSLETSRLQFLVMLEDELCRVDAIWQAAWNDLLSRGVNANLGQIQDLRVMQRGNDEQNEDAEQSRCSTPNKGSHVVVNTVYLEDVYFRSLGVSSPVAIAGSFLILSLNLLCGISQAQIEARADDMWGIGNLPSAEVCIPGTERVARKDPVLP
ncbi:hypothetical protein EDD17DRAFT_1512854 [Pisolithus thermaeus]|nr:hypothetical protein EDD17DRAFT_1512854 [Pisolithus thermaeus]